MDCYGSTFYETPDLDKLAASGLRFTDVYAAHPVCSPTRAILADRYQVSLDISDWIPGQDPQDRKLIGPQDRQILAPQEVSYED